MASVFLSYDHDDAERAAPIVSALEQAGHSVWWDRYISGGAQYNDEIEAAVEKADAVLVLWSERSIRSAWVRDEAAEGRDRGKLVPVLIDAIKPPMGFRQYQTIDMSGSGRGPSSASLQQLLDTIGRLGGTPPALTPTAVAVSSKRRSWPGRRIAVAAVAIALVAGLGFIAWTWRSQPELAVVSIVASDASPRSQALSSDLVVKLGSLANVGSGEWYLADPQSPPSTSDLIFRVAGTGPATQPQASLVLLDGKGSGILWSREFGQSRVPDADLRLQLSLMAGHVLGCALEARKAGGLPADQLKMFLAGCAEAVETSVLEPHKTSRVMRAIVEQEPGFKPAWSRLLLADAIALGLFGISDDARADAEKALRDDIGEARKRVPDLPLLKVIERELIPLPPMDYAGLIKRMEEAKAIVPDMARYWSDEASALRSVGRMSDSIDSARRAVELDPLSPATTTELINTLAWSGRIDLAREELRKAERQWPGTGALRDAQWAFHSRYGDLKFALTLRPIAPNDAYLRALLEPTPANVNLLMAGLHQSLSQSDFSYFGYAIQALGEFDKVEESFAWLNRAPPETVAEFSYVLFRPGLSEVRRDPRFMAVAKRIGLVEYWQTSGEWPDFCFEAGLPYDCKEEARKLAA